MRSYTATRPATRRLHPLRAVIALLLIATLVVAVRPAVPATAQSVGGIQMRELSNGLTVLVEPEPSHLVASVALVVRAGARDDPSDRPGLSQVLARAMTGGTTAHPSAESATAQIRAVGGRALLGVDVDLTHYVVEVPAGYADAALDMLADAMANPRFSVASLGAALNSAQDGDDVPLDGELMAALWPQHPATQSIKGITGDQTDNQANAITIGDLLAFRDRYFVARNMVLSVAGAVDVEEVFARVEQSFGTLPAGERQAFDPVDPGEPLAGPLHHPTSGDSASFVFGDSSDKARLTMAFATPGVLSPDYPAAVLLGLSLSGPGGRLFQDIRTGHGLSYDVDATTYSFSDIGTLIARASTPAENADALLARFKAVFAALQKTPPDETELANLRSQLRGENAVARESSLYTADANAINQIFGRPLDADSHFAVYDAVTPADLARVARRYFSVDRAIIDMQ